MTPTPKNPDAERLARELLAEAAGISVFALETAAGAPHVLVSDALRAIARALEQPAQEGMEHIGWEGRMVWPGVEPAGWWGMANRPEETPLAHPHTQYRRIYAGPAEGGV